MDIDEEEMFNNEQNAGGPSTSASDLQTNAGGMSKSAMKKAARQVRS